jgi:leader peptidase (prepilin peptidase) / N-methyltransferase
MTDLYPVTAAVSGALGLVTGALVPRLIAAVPEPEPDAPEEPDGPDATADPSVEREPEEPKEPYADIAARPGLLWTCAAAAAVSAAALGLVLGWSLALLVVLPLVPVGVALSVIDWRTRLLPTWLIAPAYAVTVVLILAAWLLGAPDRHDLLRAGLGWLVYGGLFFVLWVVYPRGLGYGDVRLSGVLGLALGWVGWNVLLLGIWSGILLGGILGALVALATRRRDNPFGPFMLLGALVGLVLGPLLGSGPYG